MNAVIARQGSAPENEARAVLVVDDEPSMRLALTESLRRNGYGVIQAMDGQQAIERLGKEKPWLVLTDMKMPRVSGLELLKEVKRRSPSTNVVVMTAYGTVEAAVEAMKEGASDFLLKPFAADALERVLARLESGETGQAAGRETGRTPSRPVVTQDPGMQRVLSMAEVVATSQATVLILGESGTGKELLARFIHGRSPRAHGPFIAVNCAALPEGLLESELFGYERGAFTGAMVRRIGKFEMAHGGTLMLDEISEMALGLQAKLLRVLQEREIDRVGGRSPVQIDIRVVATTNRSLRQEVEAGRFREDLYYRLNVFPITVPPLRARATDIPLLAQHFVPAACQRNGLSVVPISEEALRFLTARAWPGNVRELENAVERAVLLARGKPIEAQHFHLEEVSAGPDRPCLLSHTAPAQCETAGAGGSLWGMERELIMNTLASVGGNRTHAARRLGISIRTLRNKLREYRQLSGAMAASPGAQSEDR
jgi:two-component system response regulator FlrC